MSSVLKEIFPEPMAPIATVFNDELAASFYNADSTRLAHMRQACRTAKRIVSQMNYDKELSDKIIIAALFHDIGYSEKLAKTGFHPLDGAAYLAHCGAPEDVIEAVLWHSSTPLEIQNLPEIKVYYDKFPVPDLENILIRTVCYCDFRTSPLGESFSFGQRIVELKNRFGTGSIAPAIAKKTLPAARKDQDYLARNITQNRNAPLPWIFCDIDGTLIEPGNIIDEISANAIERFRSAGGKFSLVTGKHLISIPELIEIVGSENAHAGVNGSLINRSGDLSLHGTTIAQCKSIEETLLEAGIHYATYVTDGIWTRSDLLKAELDAFTLVGETLPQKGLTPEKKGVIKVLTFSHRNKIEQCKFVRKLAEKHGLSCVRTAEEFLEIGPAKHGKHSAAMQIMKEIGWPDLNSIAIGDSENDLTMFGHAGLSAAVANAAPEVLPAADLHIPSCQDHGVAKLLDELVESSKDGYWSIPRKWLVQH
ncbi:HAD-IIB family hydrolase [Maridesulfovibrio zosterae]|uniref:HAD-IIB family hydrolase n=1 Tax=Maridesulfovibrio zosterae TaxID=82171 RepID=UPI00041D0C45|nr:HAD-IIB family hydrolase [Maridesulfovibrio zosterae]